MIPRLNSAPKRRVGIELTVSAVQTFFKGNSKETRIWCMMKTGGGVRQGEERLHCFASLRLCLVSFSPAFTGTERMADTGLTCFCFCPVRECDVPEHSICSDRGACVLIRGSRVGPFG